MCIKKQVLQLDLRLDNGGRAFPPHLRYASLPAKKINRIRPAIMNYLAIKHLHMTCAALSGSLFLLRGIWMLRGSSMLQRRWVRVAPHLIDTLLLASALVMVFWSAQYPFVQGWLTAKVLALIAYIVLGTIALKRGKTPAVRAWAFAGALAVFAYIVLVAITKHAAVIG
jgi:uncharacterized membrane protein SirB2